MKKNSKIYIAGHSGMVGSAIKRRFIKEGFLNLIVKTHKELDLIDQYSVAKFMASENPDYVIMAAAKVGGILANNTYRAQFIYENMIIQNNLIHAAHEHKVKKLLFLGSSCIYPKLAPQPMKEEYLLSGELEYTNEPYAIAKIAGIKMCENYFRQYGDNFISVMPTNLYGPNDNFDLQSSHVLPALIHKFHEAKLENSDVVEVWGSGKPLREFLHVDDLASVCVYLMNNLDATGLYRGDISHINIGSGEEVSILQLAKMIKNIVGYEGELSFNEEYPDGMPRKLLDITRLNTLGWQSSIKLKDGLKNTYKWYQSLETHVNSI
jgi:GDP-L-fucose synthase